MVPHVYTYDADELLVKVGSAVSVWEQSMSGTK